MKDFAVKEVCLAWLVFYVINALFANVYIYFDHNAIDSLRAIYCLESACFQIWQWLFISNIFTLVLTYYFVLWRIKENKLLSVCCFYFGIIFPTFFPAFSFGFSDHTLAAYTTGFISLVIMCFIQFKFVKIKNQKHPVKALIRLPNSLSNALDNTFNFEGRMSRNTYWKSVI